MDDERVIEILKSLPHNKSWIYKTEAVKEAIEIAIKAVEGKK